MSTCYITAEPCELAEFVAAAKAQGFTVDETDPTHVSMIHEDGRGCFGCSEEEHDFGSYVGCMNNPGLDDIEMVAEGSDEYEEICADEREGGDDDQI